MKAKSSDGEDADELLAKPVSEWSDVAKESIYTYGVLVRLINSDRVVDNSGLPEGPNAGASAFLNMFGPKMIECYIVLKKSGYACPLSSFLSAAWALREGVRAVVAHNCPAVAAAWAEESGLPPDPSVN